MIILTVTGDDTPLKAVDMDVIYVRKMEAYVELYKKNEGWMDGTEAPLVVDLTEETPQKVNDE